MPDTLLTRSDLLVYCPSLSGVPAATLDAYLDAASRTVEKICDREFLSTSVVERHPVPQYARLWLRRPPVVAITSIKLFRSTSPILMDLSGNLTGPADERTSFTEVQLSQPIGYTVTSSQNVAIIKLDWPTGWTWSPEIASTSFYEVTYTGGFATAPSMVRLAIAKMVEDLNGEFTGSENMQSERIGDYAYSKFSRGSVGDLDGITGKMLSAYLRRAY